MSLGPIPTSSYCHRKSVDAYIDRTSRLKRRTRRPNPADKVFDVLFVSARRHVDIHVIGVVVDNRLVVGNRAVDRNPATATGLPGHAAQSIASQDLIIGPIAKSIGNGHGHCEIIPRRAIPANDITGVADDRRCEVGKISRS